MLLADRQIWSTQTSTAVRMRINDDGSFVLYDSSSNAVFNTGPAPIRVCTSLFPLFHSCKLIISFLSTQPTSWMTDIWASIQNKQMNLVALYGTHDSGMSVITAAINLGGNIGGVGAGISKAQNWNVTNQIVMVKTVRHLLRPLLVTYSLQGGARYLDLRPAIARDYDTTVGTADDSYYTAHYSDIATGNYVGSLGLSWSDVCSGLRDPLLSVASHAHLPHLTSLSLLTCVTGLASAMRQLAPNEVVVLELSHGTVLDQHFAMSYELQPAERLLFIAALRNAVNQWLVQGTLPHTYFHYSVLTHLKQDHSLRCGTTPPPNSFR